MLLGIADRAQCPVRFDRDVSECRACERERRGCKHLPTRIAAVVSRAGGFQCKACAVQADQAVGELVLDCLKLTDQLAELLPYLGVVDSKAKRAVGGA